MKKRTIPILTMMLALVTVAFLVLMQTQAGVVERRAAEFRNFDNTETSDIGGVPGTSIWTRTVAINPGEKVMYITMSATGDTHNGAASWFTCRVDGVPCNPGFGGAAGAPPGWIALDKMNASGATTNCNDGSGGTGDCHDNEIYYTWCKVIEPPPKGPAIRTVNLRLATSLPGASIAFIEAAHFYIDVQQGSASGTDTPTCIAGVAGP